MDAKNSQSTGSGFSAFSNDKAFGFRHLLPAVILAIIFATTFVPSASALTVTVTNTSGTPQADAKIFSSRGYGSATTNGAGVAEISWAAPEDTLLVYREATETPDATVPLTAPLPVSVTATVPDISLPGYEPGLSDRERGLIGLINQQRAAEGIAPLYISVLLDTVADGYTTMFPENFPGITDDQAHDAYYTPFLRIQNSGFPLPSAGETLSENIAWAQSATEAFEDWMHSPPHREAMLNSGWNAVGVADNGDKWIIDLTNVNPADPNYARAQMTTDTGDPALADVSPSTATVTPSKPVNRTRPRRRSPHLQLKVISHRAGRRFKLRVHIHINRAALKTGHILITVKRHQLDQHTVTTRSRSLHPALISKAGIISISARFTTSSKEWRSQSTRRVLKLTAPVKNIRKKASTIG